MKKKVLPLVILVSIMSFGRGEIVRAAVNEENVTVSAEVSDRAEAVMTESDDATPDDDFTDADSDDAMPDDDFTDADPDDPTPDDDFEDTSETILDREFVKRNTTSYADRESGKYIGWKQKDGVWYYLEYGKPITGWFSENGNQYYLSPEDGAMAVGWTQIDGQWYYFNTDGAMQTGWLNLNGDWYYLYEDGTRAEGTWIGTYYVDENGVWDESKFGVSALDVVQTTDQILVVQASGTTAEISFHVKDENGTWNMLFMTDGYVGRDGIGEVSEYVSRTPVGVFTMGMVFGIQDNPGTSLPYTKVDSTHYWVGDSSSPYYNQFVSTRDVTGFNRDVSEHLIDYGAVYNYCIDMGYNTSCTPYADSAFFIHCSSDRATGGCVSLPESYMIKLIQSLKSGAKIIIGTETQIQTY